MRNLSRAWGRSCPARVSESKIIPDTIRDIKSPKSSPMYLDHVQLCPKSPIVLVLVLCQIVRRAEEKVVRACVSMRVMLVFVVVWFS